MPASRQLFRGETDDVRNGQTTGWIIEAVEASGFENFELFQDAVLNTTTITIAEGLDEELMYEEW